MQDADRRRALSKAAAPPGGARFASAQWPGASRSMGETSAPYPRHSLERLLPELRVVDEAFPLAGSATLAANLDASRRSG